MKILVADRIAEEGLAKLQAAEGATVDVRIGLGVDELAAAVAEYDGMIIRSGVKLTKEILADPGHLRVIARAGVGVDNVDLPAATAAGVLVLNTPDANTLSTAEHAVAMLLALFRRMPQAHAHVVGGAWDRKAYVGRQLAGKTLGIAGFGRIGRAVAERALAFQMKVIAFDPFLGGDSAMDGRVTVARKLDDLLSQVDCLTLHAALTDDTKNMIGAVELGRMKNSAVLVNCARGGLVDDVALAVALTSGTIAGAAIDVFATEPPADSPLLKCDNVVLTPHLGASTAEAQTAVSTDAVDALLDYLQHGTIRNAVNVAGLPTNLTPHDRAYLDLGARMATILSPLCSEGIDRVGVTTYGGDALSAISRTLALQVLVDAMNPHIDTRLNLVNAESFAGQRGIDLEHANRSVRRDFHESVTVRVERGNEFHEVEGAVFADNRPRILSIDGYRMEIVPEGRLVLIFNDDRPGVIGLVGTVFGDHRVNIADMALSRRGNTALMLLKIDGDLPDPVLDQLRKSEPILSVRAVQLAPIPERSIP